LYHWCVDPATGRSRSRSRSGGDAASAPAVVHRPPPRPFADLTHGHTVGSARARVGPTVSVSGAWGANAAGRDHHQSPTDHPHKRRGFTTHPSWTGGGGGVTVEGSLGIILHRLHGRRRAFLRRQNRSAAAACFSWADQQGGWGWGAQ
jgi:hypothetical protein